MMMMTVVMIGPKIWRLQTTNILAKVKARVGNPRKVLPQQKVKTVHLMSVKLCKILTMEEMILHLVKQM